MKIMRVEPTPSPNSMKLTLDARLNPGVRLNYTKGQEENAPSYIRQLLAISGVSGVYHTADFIALERFSKGDWALILAAAQSLLGVADKASLDAGGKTTSPEPEEVSGFGEVTVRVQTFRGIPMQVRVQSGLEEKRAALPGQFLLAATKAGVASPNLIMERKLEDRGVRYGELEEVLDEVVRELTAVYDEERLRELVERSMEAGWAGVPPVQEGVASSDALDKARLEEDLAQSDWRIRYAAVERLQPGAETLPYLIKALADEHVSVRRLAVVHVGEIKEVDTTRFLTAALQDRSPVIRRTAGDSLSDRGDPAAVPAMEAALADSSKLVRWRAARFLYEAGGPGSLQALEAAMDEPEFEVRLQIRLAVERITDGEAAQGTVWQQMTRRNESL